MGMFLVDGTGEILTLARLAQETMADESYLNRSLLSSGVESKIKWDQLDIMRDSFAKYFVVCM